VNGGSPFANVAGELPFANVVAIVGAGPCVCPKQTIVNVANNTDAYMQTKFRKNIDEFIIISDHIYRIVIVKNRQPQGFVPTIC